MIQLVNAERKIVFRNQKNNNGNSNGSSSKDNNDDDDNNNNNNDDSNDNNENNNFCIKLQNIKIDLCHICNKRTSDDYTTLK